jgi:uncharacterized protein (TIGR00251 family)
MNAASLPYKKSKNGATLNVRVTPRSSKKGIEGVEGDTLNVRLTAPPKGGAANSQLIEVLSKELGVRKSVMKIIRGHASRIKTVEISGEIPE